MKRKEYVLKIFENNKLANIVDKYDSNGLVTQF